MKTSFRKTITYQVKLWVSKHAKHSKNSGGCKGGSSVTIIECLPYNPEIQSSDPSILCEKCWVWICTSQNLGVADKLPDCSPTGKTQALCSMRDFVLNQQSRG